MKKLILNLLTSSFTTGLFITCSILNAMQEQQSLDNGDKDKQLAIISTPNKDRRVMLYNPNIEKEKIVIIKESFEQEQKPKQEKKEIVRPKPTRPGRISRAPKEKLPRVTKSKESSVSNLEKPFEEQAEEQKSRTIYSDIKDKKFTLRRTGKMKELLKSESVKPIFAEKVDKLTFYTSSKLNMEKLFNDLESSLQYSDKVSGKSDYTIINIRIREIMNILVAAGKEIKKINTDQNSDSSNKKPRLIALISYAYNNCPLAVRDEFQSKINKSLGSLDIDFNSPVFDKNTFK
ncbi:MAG: hypothetical protein UR12_C0030G0003 [candidate division TM6 bacterium GW2011_GWF2_30_66]|jgi:hypothetical protein|nr:MAG: hypothetical protein UR12_C0030G0003 [candidate division TM6 bacterium GW2011_GWF2_30_66]